MILYGLGRGNFEFEREGGNQLTDFVLVCSRD